MKHIDTHLRSHQTIKENLISATLEGTIISTKTLLSASQDTGQEPSCLYMETIIQSVFSILKDTLWLYTFVFSAKRLHDSVAAWDWDLTTVTQTVNSAGPNQAEGPCTRDRWRDVSYLVVFPQEAARKIQRCQLLHDGHFSWGIANGWKPKLLSRKLHADDQLSIWYCKSLYLWFLYI